MRTAFPSVAAGRSQMVGTGMSYKTSQVVKNKVVPKYRPKVGQKSHGNHVWGFTQQDSSEGLQGKGNSSWPC